MTRSPLALLCAAAVLAGLAACAAPAGSPAVGAGAAASSTYLTPGGAGDIDWLARGGCRPVPAAAEAVASLPDDATVLTVRRSSGATPDTLTMSELDALPQVECTVDDHQAEGRTATFRGPLLADVFTSLGAEPGAELHTVAVNDYAVDLPTSDIRDFPVLLASRMDGERMTVAHYGPLRVVYPTTGFDLDPTVYDPRWIWQLTRIDL